MAKKKKLSIEARLKQEAENRRKLLKSLSPGARKIAEDSFRQLGLKQ
jgi:hypothetical protein